MAIRQIRLNGDEILRKKSREVDVVDEKIKELLQDMVETMHKIQWCRTCCTTSRCIKKSNCNRLIRWKRTFNASKS